MKTTTLILFALLFALPAGAEQSAPEAAPVPKDFTERLWEGSLSMNHQEFPTHFSGQSFGDHHCRFGLRLARKLDSVSPGLSVESGYSLRLSDCSGTGTQMYESFALDFSELSFAAYYSPSQWILGEMIYPRASLSLLGGWFSLEGTYDVHSNTYFAPGLGGELGVRIVPFVHRGFFIDLSVGYSWRKSSMVRVRDQDEEDDDPIYSPLVSLGEVDLSAWNGSFRGGYAF